MNCNFFTWFTNGFKCPEPTPPPQPTLRPIGVNTSAPHAKVSMEAPNFHQIVMADGNGRAGFPEVPESVTDVNLFVEHPDCEWYGKVWHFEPGGQDIFPLLVSKRPFPAEHGSVHVDGFYLKKDDNSLFQWRGVTDFLLFYKFLIGENILPRIDERVKLGFNVLRVLGMVDWSGNPTDLHHDFWPQKHADYYLKLGLFADLLASQGVRCEFVAFADAQLIMPDPAEQTAHFDKVIDTLSSKWNIFIEVCNEPFKNIPGGEQRAFDIGKRWLGLTPIPLASGAGQQGIAEGDFPQLAAWTLNYVTTHTNRGPEWPRKQKDALEVRWGLNDRFPVISDEPTGADETVNSDSRSTFAPDFGYASGTLALQVPGGTFHSTPGLTSSPFGPVVTSCAQDWMDTMKLVGSEAQSGSYTAGHLAECPIEHSDALALRTFASLQGAKATVVVLRPTADWTPIVKAGWTLVSQPKRGVLFLTR